MEPCWISLCLPSLCPFFPSSTGWKGWPEGGHLYLLPLFLVLVVQAVGHLVTWNQVSKGVIAQIDVKACASSSPFSFPLIRNTPLGNRWHCRAGGGEVWWGVSRVTCKHFFLSYCAPLMPLQAEHTSRTYRFGCSQVSDNLQPWPLSST